jgi:hypothetical protein
MLSIIDNSFSLGMLTVCVIKRIEASYTIDVDLIQTIR